MVEHGSEVPGAVSSTLTLAAWQNMLASLTNWRFAWIAKSGQTRVSVKHVLFGGSLVRIQLHVLVPVREHIAGISWY